MTRKSIPNKSKQALSKDNRRKVYLKASDFFLDLAKLVFAGVILTGITDWGVDKSLLFIAGAIVTALLAFFGFTFYIRGIKKD